MANLYTSLQMRGSESSAKLVISLAAFLHLLRLSCGASVSVELSQDLESLASSKILMDHTSSSLAPSTIENLAKVVTRASSKALPGLAQNRILSDAGFRHDVGPNVTPSRFNLDNVKSSTASAISSLHVAQCRATCLQKFANEPLTLESTSSDSQSSTVTSRQENPSWNWDDDIDEFQILPKILRSRRKRSAPSFNIQSRDSSNKITWICEKDSTECKTCWKTCQLFETGKSNPEIATTVPSSSTSSSPTSSFTEGGANEVVGTTAKKNLPGKWFNGLSQQEKFGQSKERKSKQSHPKLNCASEENCSGGCQVACSFYEKLFAKNGENEESLSWNTVTTGDPVIATKHESSVVKIVPGKISWLSAKKMESEKNDHDTRKMKRTSPVVYVVIQEYPDGKWRQIAQTTENEIDIPKELSTTMKAKLRSVRVLAVGHAGLLSVYSGSGNTSENEKIPESAINKSNNFESVLATDSRTGTPLSLEPEHKKNSESDGDVTGKLAVTEADYVTSRSADHDHDHVGGNESFEFDSSVSATLRGPELPRDNFASGEKAFGLKVVSLIHQKSLVIAELKWNDIGGNPRQEYLITWELRGGGLKGHLVTDSTSVTLSLWPDTSYTIQVEQFEQNLDSDGPVEVESSSSSLKSPPLTVDTSDASFQVEKSPLHYSDEDEASEYYYHHDPEHYARNGNEKRSEEEVVEAPPHKSITELHKMTLILVITVCATILVFVILLATAFTWTRLKSWRKVGCSFCFTTSGNEPHLLSSQEDIASSDDISKCTVHSFDSPMGFVVGLKKGWRNHKRQNIFQPSFGSSHPEKLAGLKSEAPVAVISSSIPAPSPLSHCFTDNVWSNKSVSSKPTFSSSRAATSCVGKVASAKSLSNFEQGNIA